MSSSAHLNRRGLTSVVSYRERGPWGQSRYRGNCSGYLIKDLLSHYQPKMFVDPAQGSGTSGDVVADLRSSGETIEYYGFDLKDGFNLLRDSLVARLPREADLVFFHPPYHRMIPYSGPGGMWGQDSQPHPDDLSNCASYQDFLDKIEKALFNIYEATRNQGMYSVLVGDLRKDGTYISMQSDILKMAPGKLDGIIIKQQFNCVSDSRHYSGKFVPILHEYLLNFKREGIVFGLLDATLDVSRRLGMLSDATWSALVSYALKRLGGQAPLQEIYRVIEETATPKTESLTRPNWQAKVRKVLQQKHRNLERGYWALAA